uniref:NADH dehydrogenase subunit 4L n=1 Tax=Strombidium cf. sulcatum TaxID=2793073 RepID=A0A7T0M4N8_9SPIT|nr:NADH dehydrogenase subunit 4L [Strombidium cf. sulcatum]QPL15966.1 NADH dehydrogenase subunit 4L [Strombidium cf. sulcatum]
MMVINELNFLYLSFFLFLFSIFINVTTALHLLLTAEMLWILLYIVSLFVGYIFNSLNILTLTFFLLILSAVEFGIGLVIMLIQHIIFRSINLNSNSFSSIKFFNKWSLKLKLNKLKFF